MIFLSNMLAEESINISILSPPTFNPVKYWRSPSPVKLLILSPDFSL